MTTSDYKEIFSDPQRNHEAQVLAREISARAHAVTAMRIRAWDAERRQQTEQKLKESTPQSTMSSFLLYLGFLAVCTAITVVVSTGLIWLATKISLPPWGLVLFLLIGGAALLTWMKRRFP